MDMITVCCLLWSDPYGVRNPIYIFDETHVRALKQMVEKHLTIPHEFICVTHQPIEGIDTRALDWAMHIPGTRFMKLMLYRPNGVLAGKRILYLDIDTIITGNIDPLVERDEDLVLWRNPNFGQPGRARYNTSMILHTVGARPELWADFDRVKTWPMLREKWGGTDQAWISHRASPEEAHWTDKDGVYGAGRLGDSVEGAGTELPNNARIVFTPGQRAPHMPHMIKDHPWIKEHYPLWAETS